MGAAAAADLGEEGGVEGEEVGGQAGDVSERASLTSITVIAAGVL